VILPPLVFPSTGYSLSRSSVGDEERNRFSNAQDVSDLGFGSSDLRGCRLPLETIDLSENSLSQIGPGAFGQLSKLKNLRLDGNNLNVLEDKAFGGLQSLQSLNLANNRIVALPPELFTDQSESLRELYLQNNSLSVLAPGLFSPLRQLLVPMLYMLLFLRYWQYGE
jgi:Leucine-rich repeat (LRR) protein